MRNIKSGSTPLTLLGSELKTGDKAPQFQLTTQELQEAKLSDYLALAKPALLSIVPSLDTPVCNIQTRRFNQEAAGLPGITFITISKDLPFAQKRWCAAAGVKNVVTLSDYRHPEFGLDYGLLIKEMYLLARSVFVIDAAGVIRYMEIVPDLGKEPDYKKVIDAAKQISGGR